MALYFKSRAVNGLAARRIVVAGVAICALSFGWVWVQRYVDFTSIVTVVTAEKVDYRTLSRFKEVGAVLFYPAAAAFSVLAPMPWWQEAPPALLSYQVFAYAQTWYALTAMVACFYAFRSGAVPPGGTIVVMFSGVLFIMGVVGSLNFGSLYFQVALPFVLLICTPYLAGHVVKCVGISAAIIVLAHGVLAL
jgi:hypothetical protein